MLNIKLIKTNSDLLAIFIAETLICSMIGSLISIPYISVLATLALIFAAFCVNRGSFERNILSCGAIFIIIMMLLVFSGIKNGFGNLINYLLSFACFGFAAAYFASLKTDVKRVFKTLGKIYFIYIVFYLLVIKRGFVGSEDYWEQQMGIAYGFVAIVLVGIISVMYRKNFLMNKKQIFFTLLYSGAALALMLIDTGTRGAIVSVAIGFVIAYLAKQSNVKKILLIILISTAAILCIAYYKEIILFAADVLESLGIRVGAIDKMVFMLNQNSEANGRDVLYAAAQRYFLNSPIWGNGIGFFESRHNIYVHNLIFEIMCEFGIIGLIICSLMLIKKVKRIFSFKSGMPKYLIMFLFCSTIPMLTISNTYWLLPHFWILFFYDGRNNVDIETLSAPRQASAQPESK